MVALTRSLEETETRALALTLLKVCISRVQRRAAVFMLLPIIAFAQEDPGGLIQEGHSAPEFVFEGFDKRTEEECADIIGYLAQRFGDTYCGHRMELIADCLIFGSGSYPEMFGGIKKMMVQKCWKMLEGEKNAAKIDKIAAVSASFFAVPSRSKIAIKLRRGRVDDGKLATYIGGTIAGMAERVNAK
jgi:hypothetical protein